ncbi:uncharacterized protein N7479_002315 [Penicillium vulpinum]|uniref:Aminoglycoside phosphotransferase domain-containing protein n=1 Tax=Penicillium vulpinum TaxID=29845 RepID=A0A1V6S776_9EURO|nr:uncharacterized protein N7479_002315 [Penicillium vulpinum]KAJ5972397.1 hypothetical protein N7479_002315 [Penicillium vulpinum]OQE09921.1 hypothetical protein PENVUL_c005G08051 [Penicillium vulpinum]
MIATEFNEGPFKLICDDLGLANMIVKSSEDLTIVGIVDLEWVYAGPAQLFCSAPWWLLYDRPINEEWDFKMGKPPELNNRFFKCLDMFVRILAEEESKTLGNEEVSTLVQWSMDSGAMWLHMLLSCGFLDMSNFPYAQLQGKTGPEILDQALKKLRDTAEVKDFIERKMNDLCKYDEDLDKIEEYNAVGKMTREEFVISVQSLLRLDE